MNATKAALAAGLALALGLTEVGAATAATGSSPRPSAPSGPKGCEIKMPNADGSSYSVYYDHGSTVTLRGSDGRTVTKKCNNGTWESTKVTATQTYSSGPTTAARG